jgi:hypothetical protein
MTFLAHRMAEAAQTMLEGGLARYVGLGFRDAKLPA